MSGDTPSADRRAAFDTVQPGQVLTGVVSQIASFGVVFIDLGGLEGMINLPELSWTRVRHPSDIVTVGQEVKVKVLDVDARRGRISLSLKALQEDPLLQFARDHPVGCVLCGTVTKLTPIGTFVSIANGIEGLVTDGADGSSPPDPATPAAKVGAEAHVRLVEIDLEHRRIRLAPA